ncbi:Hypothetical protein, putative [Bodo saltans]|uniref:DH domain-containing protein n=1 Tax=Bodo saltans TaxID=75058 RepID=A0A0S4IYY1_BODSA|nr:Hypothetical protein, putative [Bodo saltans]|eukprot:CUF83704.1 Hypothetical protein, putative [Bodo saltans]
MSSDVSTPKSSNSPRDRRTTAAVSMTADDFHSSTSTEALSARQSALDARYSAASAVFSAVDTEFYESEALYLGALETLWIAYLQPLINAQHSGESGEAAHNDSRPMLATTFGADVQAMIECHRGILESFSQSARSQSLRASSKELSKSEMLGSSVTTSSTPLSPERAGDRETVPVIVTSRVSSTLDDSCVGESFPLILLRMAPMLASAYTRYVTKFSSNLAAAQAVREGIPKGLWGATYEALARLTIRERVMPWFSNAKTSDDDATLSSGKSTLSISSSVDFETEYIDNTLMSFSTDFSALVTLPVQRIARYALMIKEWVKCHADEANLEMFSSPIRQCQVEVNKLALDAAERMHEICSSVEEIRSMMESTQRLMKLERRFRIPNAGLSQHEGMTIVHDSFMTRAKDKKKGKWHMKPCYAILLTRVLLFVQLHEDNGTKYKHVVPIPLSSILNVRRLASEAKLSKELNGAHGLVIRYIRSKANEKGRCLSAPKGPISRLLSSITEDSNQPDSSEEVLVLLDDDAAHIDIWVLDLSSQVMNCT